MANELLYYIPAGQYGKEGVLALLEQHPEIKFVSLVGIDLAGNDTEKFKADDLAYQNLPDCCHYQRKQL